MYVCGADDFKTKLHESLLKHAACGIKYLFISNFYGPHGYGCKFYLYPLIERLEYSQKIRNYSALI